MIVTIMTMSMAMYVCFMRYSETECSTLRSLAGRLMMRLTRADRDAVPYTGESGMTEPLSRESSDARCCTASVADMFSNT